MLVRTINEGATIVMKAINKNTGKSMRQAVGLAPRGKRTIRMLNVTVGTQSISPLMWSLESGAIVSSAAILKISSPSEQTVTATTTVHFN